MNPDVWKLPRTAPWQSSPKERQRKITFTLFGPDSPQLSLGEPDEENSTEPHVQLPLLFPPVAPSHFAGCASLLHSPAVRRSLFASAFPNKWFFSSPQPRFAAFLPPVCHSYSPSWLLSGVSGLMDPWPEKSWQTAECFLPVLPPISSLSAWSSCSLLPLSVSFPLFGSVLSNRALEFCKNTTMRKYLCIPTLFFFFFPS